MAKYERSGKVRVPQWWLDKVLPLLDDRSINYAEIARLASRHAGRRSPWGASAISKFASGEVRTIELTNGISAALAVVQPFFVAPNEAAASAMTVIVKREHGYADAMHQKLSVFDRVADKELRSKDVDPARNAAVVSAEHGSQGGRGVRARRAGRSRA
jgi:hypothetical protein